MSGNFNDKIINFEITPPNEVWKKIADQLDGEFKTGDIYLSQKMYDYEINPPSFIFEKVLSGLNAETEVPASAKVYKFPIKRLTAAAAIIGLIAVSLFYLVRPESSITSVNPTAEETAPLPDRQVPPPSRADQNNTVSPNPGLRDPGYAASEKTTNRKALFSNNP